MGVKSFKCHISKNSFKSKGDTRVGLPLKNKTERGLSGFEKKLRGVAEHVRTLDLKDFFEIGVFQNFQTGILGFLPPKYW